MLRIEPDLRARRQERKIRGLRTGVVGVSLESSFVSGRRYDSFIASWPEEGVERRRRFSVGRYGRAEARRLAIQARRAGVAAVRRAERARQRVEAAGRLSAAPRQPMRVTAPALAEGHQHGASEAEEADGSEALSYCVRVGDPAAPGCRNMLRCD